jgi:hypothetical protein
VTPIRRSDLTGSALRQSGASALAAVGLFAMVAGLIDVLFPDVLPNARWAIVVGVLVAGAIFGAARAWPAPVREVYATPAVTISVVAGDLLAQPGHLVVGMTDTFDTATGIISEASVQAQFLREFYGGDASRFDADIDRALAGTDPVGRVRKLGKDVRYPVGTVATTGGPDRRFFCVAYSSMNERNEARATIDGVWTSLSSLWAAVCAHANGGPVAMPVIGQGQARLSQALSPADAIRLQVLSFWLACRQEKVCDELRVVVAPAVYDRLDRRDLQAFLTSLRPS